MSLRTYKRLQARTRLSPKSKGKPCPPKPSRPVRLEQVEWEELKRFVFDRAKGWCECWMVKWRRDGTDREYCSKRLTFDWHPHHIVPRSHGGPDEDTNIAAIRPECHEDIHGTPQWSSKR